jgi:hypothetical protein
MLILTILIFIAWKSEWFNNLMILLLIFDFLTKFYKFVLKNINLLTKIWNNECNLTFWFNMIIFNSIIIEY